MSKSNALETSFLKLLLNREVIAPLTALGVTIAGGTANLYIALHKTDPGEAGTQDAGEPTVGPTGEYGGYVRKAAFAQDTVWTVANNQAKNAAELKFEVAAAGTTGCTIHYFSIGTVSTGASPILLYGTVNAPDGLVIAEGTTPVFPINAVVITED